MSEREPEQRTGPTIEAEIAAIATGGREPQPAESGELHVCPDCASRLVYPTHWAPVPERRWSVALRCPECEWRGVGVHDQDVVDRFDEVLDIGIEQMLADLEALSRANLEDELERFVRALEADEILPEDF